MASSRASSPASAPASNPGSVAPLTPRSKIKALLATVESSDEESSTRSVENTHGSPHSSSSRNKPNWRKSTSPRVDLLEYDSDDADVPIRPRGKLASRMQGAADAPRSSPQGSPEPTTARERVKKMLQDKEVELGEQSDTVNADLEGNNDEDDEDLPVAPRRLKRRALVQNASDSEGSPSTRAPSPGLFVSSPIRPSPAKNEDQAGDESDNGLPTLKSDRFKALVERKRQERLAREAAEQARQAERRAMQEKLTSEMEELVSGNEADEGITDDEGGRRLTQGARPVRKASKKAIEDMNRETQRMARNMQLAHEAKTRKKISKASLFEKFNYKPAGFVDTVPLANSSSRPTTPHSDVEMKDAETPPSSPPAAKDLASVEELLAETPAEPTAEAQPAAVVAEESGAAAPAPEKVLRRVRVRMPTVAANMATLHADDDLQITATSKDKLAAVFDKIPSKKSGESHSLQALRALAQVRSPGQDARSRYKKQRDGSNMTPGELQAYLHLKSRQQAKVERDRRLEMLKGQGIVIQTAEEREKQEQEVEDLVAKAREEAQKIMEEERDAAKQERKANGGEDPLAWDDSDEEDYRDSADEADAELSDGDLSGSEDEEELGEDDGALNPLFDDEAASEVSESEDVVTEQAEEDEADARPTMRARKPRTKTAVLSDDEAEVEATPRPDRVMASQVTPAAASRKSPSAPGSVLRSAKKTFIPGLPVQGPAGLGLTQIFAGTMDTQMSPSAGGPTQLMMPDFDDFPDSNFSATMEEAADAVVVDSQKDHTQGVTQGLRFDLSQSQMHGLDSLLRDATYTQASEMIEFSQDAGLQHQTPLRERFVEPPISTVETVIADKEDSLPQDSPLVRRGKLRRKADVTTEEVTQPATEDVGPDVDAFSAMNEAAKKEKKLRAAEEFDRKKSKAKEMVEEQAEESEDEYAGLGGVDGDGSDNESDGSVEEMIDDAAGNDHDERKLAAFYADRERASDEQAVEKLFKDITTGQLRRKRGAEFDLSDSDDDGEARRRMKRRQFAKMQKALFADERVKKIAENPGNQAFLRTMEDRGSDDEDMGFLDVVDSPSQVDTQSQPDSQADGQQHQQTIPDSQPAPLEEDARASENRLPANARRTKNGKKPSNIGEVRETLSSLLDEPQGSVIPATEAGSDSEEDLYSDDKENQRATLTRTASVSVVDRISLKRNASSASVCSSTSRLAFTTASQSSSFKVPALLRRATTNSTLISGSSSTTSSTASGFGEEAKIKKGATKGSGVNGFAARANEKTTMVQESERRRQQKRARGAERRVGVVGGLLNKGTFG